MASELIVQTLKGPTSGANANKVIIPSGQTLDASAGGFTPASGQIIQTVKMSTTSTSNHGSTSFADTNLTLDITPTSSDSIIIGTMMAFINVTTSAAEGQFRVLRDSTDLNGGSNWSLGTGGSSQIYVPCTFSFWDEPSSTSSTTYKLQSKVDASGPQIYVYRKQFFILQEIAG